MLYVLRHKTEGYLIEFSVSSNGDDAEFCNDTTVYFEKYGEGVWVAKTLEQAEKALTYDPQWYNSCVEYPCHSSFTVGGYKNHRSVVADEFEIVELDLK